jgi:hypothetical protein
MELKKASVLPTEVKLPNKMLLIPQPPFNRSSESSAINLGQTLQPVSAKSDGLSQRADLMAINSFGSLESDWPNAPTATNTPHRVSNAL